jgi:hypothetical protein
VSYPMKEALLAAYGELVCEEHVVIMLLEELTQFVARGLDVGVGRVLLFVPEVIPIHDSEQFTLGPSKSALHRT